jgi:lipoprotein-releasing system permease protein
VNLSFFIARRYFLHRKGAFSSFIIKLAIVATTISVATMIMAVAILTGFKSEIHEKLFSFWGHVQIQPYLSMDNNSVISPEPIERDGKLEANVKRTAHVLEMNVFVVRPAIINANEVIEGVQLKGIESDYKLPSSISFSGKGIDFTDTAYAKTILLSDELASRMNIKPGDAVQVNFIEPDLDMPRIRKLIVSGTYHTGMEEIDKNYAICDIRLLQRINNWQANQVNGYQIKLDDADLADTVSKQLYHAYVKPPLTTYTMRELFPALFDWLQLTNIESMVLIAIMAVVAIINLAAALLILIVEQARLVGILKAQGMSRAAIQKIFLYHATLIAGIGVIAGNLLAFGLCWLLKETELIKLKEAIYSLKYVPVKLYWWQPVVVDVATVLLCILCMWLPSLYIRRIQPARVLQFK